MTSPPSAALVTTPLETGARRVLEIELSAIGTASSATDVAAAIVRAWEKLDRHVARLIGTDGIRSILGRSVILGRKQFAWLESEPRTTVATATGWPALERSLALQPPERAIAAFVSLLEIVVGLLGRFIGDDLVARLLHEIWPEAPWNDVKESP